MLSDGNWSPTCCTLGSLLMNREEKGQRRRIGKGDRRKHCCVMHGHRAKEYNSFIKPWSIHSLRLNIYSYCQGDTEKETFTHPTLLSSDFLLFFCFIVNFSRFSSLCRYVLIMQNLLGSFTLHKAMTISHRCNGTCVCIEPLQNREWQDMLVQRCHKLFLNVYGRPFGHLFNIADIKSVIFPHYHSKKCLHFYCLVQVKLTEKYTF